MDASPEPLHELEELFQQESLESRFQRQVVSILRRISDGGYFPAKDLLEDVEKRGAIAFVRDWLQDERATPSLDLLAGHDRPDLIIERYVDRVPYCFLFTSEETELARSHLPSRWTTAGAFPEPPSQRDLIELGISNLSQDGNYTDSDLLALQRRRDAEFREMSPIEKALALEEELTHDYPFTCSGDVVLMLRNSNETQRFQFPLLYSQMAEVTEARIKPDLESLLKIVHPVLDLSADKVSRVANMLSWNHDSALHYLTLRTALICFDLGYRIWFLSSVYFSDASVAQHTISPAMFEGFEKQASADLRSAVVIGELLPFYNLRNSRDLVPIVSFEDLPETEHVNIRNFTDLTDEDLEVIALVDIAPPDVDREAVISFVKAQMSLEHQAASQVGQTAVTLWDRQDRENGRSGKDLATFQQILAITGPDRQADAERRVSSLTGPIFYQLCVEARTALLGAQFTLMDGWHPEPSLAMVAIGVAFEHQLRVSFLEPLAQYVLDHNGRCDFPDGKLAIVRNGYVLERKPLEHVLCAISCQHPLLKSFCESQGLNRDDLVKAIVTVKDRRNRAAHEGGASSARVTQYFAEMLKAPSSIFSVLMPSSLQK